jgi:RHS repeat-associated protein
MLASMDPFPIRFSTKYTDLETTTTTVTTSTSSGSGGSGGSGGGSGGSGSTTVNVSASLIYFGYRFYNPDTARWLTRDPIGEKGGLDLYAYVRNDPVDGYDPTGLEDKSKVCCKGRRTYIEYVPSGDPNLGGGLVPVSRYKKVQKEISPNLIRTDPKEACCCQLRHDRSFSTEKADWGKCCWCRLYVLRTHGAGWPGHVWFYMECDNGNKGGGHFYFGKRKSSYIPEWFEGIAERTGKAFRRDSGFDAISMSEYDCDVFPAIMSAIASDAANPPDYITGVHDYYWWANKMMDMGASIGYGHDW